MQKPPSTTSNTSMASQIPRTALEKALDFIGASGFVAMLFVIMQYWPSLPKQVPSHFGISGAPDGWSGKSTLLLLPVISAVIYLGLTVLSFFPQTYNYLWLLTPQNAKLQYQNARQMIVFLKTEIIWLFAYVVWQTIKTAQGKSNGLGAAFLPVFLLFIFGTIGFYLFKAYRER